MTSNLSLYSSGKMIFTSNTAFTGKQKLNIQAKRDTHMRVSEENYYHIFPNGSRTCRKT